MTFTFTMDAFPDYTKFDKTHKVLAAIQVIDDPVGEEDAGVRQPCMVDPVDKSIQITYDNASTEKLIKLTASGDNVDGKNFYSKTLFGTLNGNATELEFNLPVESNKTYVVTQQNPALAAFYETGDNGVIDDVKTKDYLGSELAEGYSILLCDEPGLIEITLEEKNNGIKTKIQTIQVTNNLTFKTA